MGHIRPHQDALGKMAGGKLNATIHDVPNPYAEEGQE